MKNESNFSSLASLNAAKRCLERFSCEPQLAGFRQVQIGDEVIVAAKRAINAIQNARVAVFNPFISSGYRPTEDDFSNILAKLFDPSEPHQFGKSLLCALLDAVGAGAAKEKALQINEIRRLIILDDRISVGRNWWHPLGKVDIAIFGTDFAIFVENKIRGGSETETQDGMQAVRYAEVLRQHIHDYSIDSRCILAVYLTPEGKSASDAKFLSLTTSGLARALLNATDANVTASEETRQLTRAFLLTYDWLN